MQRILAQTRSSHLFARAAGAPVLPASSRTTTYTPSSVTTRAFGCPSKSSSNILASAAPAGTTTSSTRSMSKRSRQQTEPGPLETTMRTKLTERFQPSYLNIINDSHLHAGHAAMKAIGGGNGETHFTVEITASEFEGKRAMQRHRLVYSALQTELNSGLHALQIRARSPKEAGEEEQGQEQEGQDTAASSSSSTTATTTAPPASGNERAPAGP